MQALNTTKRLMSTKQFPLFKSLLYSSHDPADCTQVLKVHSYTPKVGADESILLRTLAFPINPSDINQLQGVYPSVPEKTLDYSTEKPAAIAGNEGVFEVMSVPQGERRLAVGDWVIPLYSNTGTWTNYQTCRDAGTLVKVNGLDLYTAATIAVNGCTAYQLVNDYVQWDPSGNEWIVQNAGTSAVSKIVTQVAQARGVKTLSVIRDRENFAEVAKELEERYGATKVISETQNNDKDFSKDELPVILGPNARVRLALNSVGGKSSGAIARKLERDGTMLTYGGMSRQPVTVPTTLLIFNGLKSLGYWITENTKRNPQSKIDTISALMRMYGDGQLQPPEADIKKIEWDVQKMNDEQLLEAVKNGIQSNGKSVVVLKW
ncbi:AEL081Wp [Eremothecium gossypii ATCC 10895]|uniref:Enoyl-[acyl-carrier-protein] reductase, mitochondrial n=1 Tax=Eremothecium gossypii (strain ATCC 10895 / CBS 109.51 / FGSC 9923 / NRRL Y-1056) TaxID=284811 RepID=ETR1_EREGS|nr:AEL081Wp [Eremothecium gossypii ATCC 10895]Q757U3.2 RecName: Full=Enoyl-[acyl-carrier-protein] reductase, mitochondrial; AltName: Full=2-enoyl thioester reductase; Flags: Precursor [Eremothecium gossypii ATCC 10895]AAS52604.2 AEL081Wp [Eremothecium gossypii ATCC 10895]AEY96907.1 FAEL081Wp [Eremothecium gossypii FDAG1]